MAADVTDCWNGLAKWLDTRSFSDVELCNTFHGKIAKEKYQPPPNVLINFLYDNAEEILETTGYAIRYHETNGIGTFEIHRQLSRDPSELKVPASSKEEEGLKVEEYGFDQIFQDIPTKDEQIFSLNEDTASMKLPWADSGYLPSSYSFDLHNISQNSFNARCQLVSDDPNKVLTMNIPYPYAQFGHDMVVGDFNGDGIQDLGDLSMLKS